MQSQFASLSREDELEFVGQVYSRFLGGHYGPVPQGLRPKNGVKRKRSAKQSKPAPKKVKIQQTEEAARGIMMDDEESTETESENMGSKIDYSHMVTLYCSHCDLKFMGKATWRTQFSHAVVNHKCSGGKRTQFVVGKKHRRCMFGCNKLVGCIRVLSDSSCDSRL